jgi:hypothetical protein
MAGRLDARRDRVGGGGRVGRARSARNTSRCASISACLWRLFSGTSASATKSVVPEAEAFGRCLRRARASRAHRRHVAVVPHGEVLIRELRRDLGSRRMRSMRP